MHIIVKMPRPTGYRSAALNDFEIYKTFAKNKERDNVDSVNLHIRLCRLSDGVAYLDFCSYCKSFGHRG